MTPPTTSDLARVHDRIDELGKSLIIEMKLLNEKVTAISTMCPPCQVRLGAVETILHGPPANGKNPGLVTRMHQQEQEAQRIKAAVGRVKMAVGAIALTVLGAFLQALLGKFW